MRIRCKKLHPEAKMPFQASKDAAGFDLTALTKTWDEEHCTWKYGTGLALEIPTGYVGILVPRSSVFKTGLTLANSLGVIDADYRGEVIVLFRETGSSLPPYEVGDRVAQLLILPLPTVTFQEVDELSKTGRETGGFGSTSYLIGSR